MNQIRCKMSKFYCILNNKIEMPLYYIIKNII